LLIVVSCISEKKEHIAKAMQLALNIKAGAEEDFHVLSTKTAGDDSSIELIQLDHSLYSDLFIH